MKYRRQQGYIFLCKNTRKPSVYKEYKKIRKEEEEDAGVAGLPRMIINPIFTGIQETKKRKIAVKHAWKAGGSRIPVFIRESLQAQCLQGVGGN